MLETANRTSIRSGVFGHAMNGSLFSNDSGMPVLTDDSELKPLDDIALVTEPEAPKKNFIKEITEWLQGGGANEVNTLTSQGVNLYNIITGKPVQPLPALIPAKTENPLTGNTGTPALSPENKQPATQDTSSTQKEWVMPVVVVVIAIVIGIVTYFISKKKNA